MSLKDLLQNEIKVNNIKVKVISKHDENIIVGDSSMLAICHASNSAFNNLIEGQSYMILKPIKLDMNSFFPNEKFKPIKMANLSLSPKKTEINKLIALIQAKQIMKPPSEENSKTQLTTFQDIMKLVPNSEIKTIIVKIITISKNITGQFGNYNIGKVKDISNEKMDINLYSKQVKNIFEVGEIVELRKLKITEYAKDGEKIKRLATTSRSNGRKCNSDTEKLFKDIPLGDEREDGIIVAIHDIFPYLSCSKCWKKTSEDDSICQCENNENIHVNDFHCQFYIETIRDNEIKVIHTFRRQTNLTLDTQISEDIQKTLENKYLEKTFTFEWNIKIEEKEEEEKKLIMVIIKENDHS